MWNGSTDALLRRDREDAGVSGRAGGVSGIPVRASGRVGHSESVAGADGPPGFRIMPRTGLPLPCQTFPACRNGGHLISLHKYYLSISRKPNITE